MRKVLNNELNLSLSINEPTWSEISINTDTYFYYQIFQSPVNFICIITKYITTKTK